MANIDRAYERLIALIKDVEPRLSTILTEEDAKLQLVVRVLTEILNWGHSDVSAERKNENGYSDYIVSHNNCPAFLVEAKRIGAIGLATTASTKQHYKISGPALRPSLDGIAQAASYCAPEGIQLGIVTDGATWIFFRPFIPGANYRTKEAIVFPQLSSIAKDFATFYELASKEGHEKSLYKNIFDKIHDSRLLLTLGRHSAFGDADIHPEHKSQMAFDLDGIFNSFFAGLVGDTDPDLLIECFVESKESRIADFALEKLTTYVLGNISPPEKDVDESLSRLIASTISDQHGETVFIVGPSGAGKSTFVERFFKKTLPNNIRERCVVINVNALNASGDPTTLSAWFTNDAISIIEEQLYPQGFPDWDQLLGLYHLDYKRRSEGVDAELYKHDKKAFKRQFGEYMDAQVEKDREGYLRRLLSDIVENRKKLPIFVIDNTDEFSLDYKQALFQYFQALRRHVTHCLLLFPLTDRSAWAFGKTEIVNIYSSKSYFLPTPPPREVFRKRLDYLKSRIKPSGSTAALYDAGISMRVKLESLEAFAAAIEEILVDQDYVATRLGSLANYNIRKTLTLARRVMTSSVLGIEDLIKTYLAGSQEPLAPQKFMRALMLGDYNFYKHGDVHMVFPVFDVDDEIAQSPLIHLRVLAPLKAIHDGRSSDESRYLPISSLTQYFDGMGYSESAVERSLSALMDAGLISPHDPSAGSLALAQRVAITHSGLTHLELALFNPTFFEEMALTAMIANAEIATQLRSLHSDGDSPSAKLRNIRQKFAGFLLEEDDSFGRVPASDQYNVQRAVTEDIRKYAGPTPDSELLRRDTLSAYAQPGLLGASTEGTVDWFDQAKGFGFVTIEELGQRAFLHVSVLEKAGINTVHDGDVLIVDIARSHKGIAVSTVKKLDVGAGSATDNAECIVVKVFEDRGYGFVHVPTLSQDAFFHVSVLPEEERGSLSLGMKFVAEINADSKGRGFQVRRIVKS